MAGLRRSAARRCRRSARSPALRRPPTASTRCRRGTPAGQRDGVDAGREGGAEAARAPTPAWRSDRCACTLTVAPPARSVVGEVAARTLRRRKPAPILLRCRDRASRWPDQSHRGRRRPDRRCSRGFEGRSGRGPDDGDEHASHRLDAGRPEDKSHRSRARERDPARCRSGTRSPRPTRTMASGSASRHGRDQWHHDDGCAGGMEPVDETLSLLTRARDEYAAPG